MEEISLSQLSILSDAEISAAFDECWKDVEASVLMKGPDGYRRVKRWLDIEPGASAMAFAGKEPAGIVLTGIRPPNRAYIASLAVKAEHRGRGIGRRLMKWGISRARIYGCSKVGLHVFEKNAGAVSLYKSLGFDSVRRVGHWQGHIESGNGRSLEISYPASEKTIDWLGAEQKDKLWENEPTSLANLGDGLIFVRGSRKGSPVGYVAYSTRSLCWIIDMGFIPGTPSQTAAELLLAVPMARFAPAVMTTVAEGSDNERIAREIGLKLERSRIEMRLALSSEAVS